MAEGDATSAAAAEFISDDAKLLLDTVVNSLPQSIAALERLASGLPSGEDFHFFSNFPEFRGPVLSLQRRLESLLSQFSSLSILPRAPSWPSGSDEDLHDWLVGTQDEILELVDSNFDRFKQERSKQGVASFDDGFIFQNTRKRRRKEGPSKPASQLDKNADKGNRKLERCPVPFHIRSIPRPQDKFESPVDNSNTPFKHPKHLSGRAEGMPSDEYVQHHPLQQELLSMGFEDLPMVDRANIKKPEGMLKTPFTFVNTPAALKHVALKLLQEKEIAVDLEHHQFRSFQGLTCLMQISTRSEDFVIDTLELRSFVGPQLRDVFANPNIQKVMHGADWDIMWLQRDFGIYVCNLFDTGQASRVLGFKSFSLSYLLENFCGVAPDKRYQMADWRLRPLTEEMLSYAREDTHYLLYVGDMLKQMLISTRCCDLEGPEPLREVCKRSRDICLKLYEKEITTSTSYLQVYGLHEKQFHAEQLAVLSGLYMWRDQVARAEDESTGYVLPNHLLLKLAEEMPDTAKKLHPMLKGKHTLVARNIGTIVDIINKSKSMASMFKEQSDLLLKTQPSSSQQKKAHMSIFEEIPFEDTSSRGIQNDIAMGVNERNTNGNAALSQAFPLAEYKPSKQKHIVPVDDPSLPSTQTETGTNIDTVSEPVSDAELGAKAIQSDAVLQTIPAKVGAVMKKKEAKGLASMFGKKSMLQTKSGGHSDKDSEQVEAKLRAEKIRASFVLPFHNFAGMDQSDEQLQRAQVLERRGTAHSDDLQRDFQTEEVILFENQTKVNGTPEDNENVQAREGTSNCETGNQRGWWPDVLSSYKQSAPDFSEQETTTTGSKLPLSISEKYRGHGTAGHHFRLKSSVTSEIGCTDTDLEKLGDQVESFDYAAARKNMGFFKKFEDASHREATSTDKRKFKYPKQGSSRDYGGEVNETVFDPLRRMKEFKPDGISPGKRRQVFPQTGNRTGVFK